MTTLTNSMELVMVVKALGPVPPFTPVVSFLSEPMWPIEARNAAIANTYFVGCNNRVGTVSSVNTLTVALCTHNI